MNHGLVNYTFLTLENGPAMSFKKPMFTGGVQGREWKGFSNAVKNPRNCAFHATTYRLQGTLPNPHRPFTHALDLSQIVPRHRRQPHLTSVTASHSRILARCLREF